VNSVYCMHKCLLRITEFHDVNHISVNNERTCGVCISCCMSLYVTPCKGQYRMYKKMSTAVAETAFNDEQYHFWCLLPLLRWVPVTSGLVLPSRFDIRANTATQLKNHHQPRTLDTFWRICNSNRITLVWKLLTFIVYRKQYSTLFSV